MELNFGFASDIGMKRQQNQDSGIACPELGLFVVADGMGGHQGGEIASKMVTEIVPEVVRKGQKKKDWNGRQLLVEAIQEANRSIYKKSREDRKLMGMGTTTTSLLFHDGKLLIGHVGDSRCYFAMPGIFWQLTRDHSLVQEKLRAGLITRAQLKTDQMRNVITRSVGFEPEVQVEIYEKEAHEKDVFLVCSDGLTGMLEDQEVRQTIDEEYFTHHDLQKTIERLISEANANGGDDNVTVLMASVKKA